MKSFRFVVAVSLACWLSGALFAGQPEDKAADSPPKPPLASPPKPVPPRDPTQPGAKMRDLFTAPSAAPGAIAAPLLPVLALRSRVIGADGEGVATLEIDDRRLMVRQETEFSWSPVGGGPPQLLRVVELNAQRVVVEFSQLNRKVVLR